MDIFCKVEGQRLKIETPMRHFPEGSEEFVRFLFTFSSDWSSLLVTTFAQFRQNRNVANIYLTDYTDPADGITYKSVYLPRTGVTGMTFEPGLLTMTLYGTSNERVIGTTNYVVLCLDPTGFVGGETSDMSETLYQQLVNRFIEYEWRYDLIQNYRGAWEAMLGALGDAPTWTELPVTAQGTAPATPSDGDFWYDTTNSVLKKYKASTTSWETITGKQAEATAPPDVYYWYDTSSGKLYRTPIAAIPVATASTVGGFKLDTTDFAIGTGNNAGKLTLNNTIARTTRVDALEAEVNKRAALTYTSATHLHSGDLDDILTPNTYVAMTMEDAYNIFNAPAKSAFMLHVLRPFGGPGRVYQIAEVRRSLDSKYNGQSGIFVRRKIDDSTAIPSDPPTPIRPIEPTAPGPDPTPEETAAYEEALAEYDAAMAEYEAAVPAYIAARAEWHAKWSSWQMLLTNGDLTTFRYVRELTNDDNIDNLNVPGVYLRLTGITEGSTLYNSEPTHTGYALLVFTNAEVNAEQRTVHLIVNSNGTLLHRAQIYLGRWSEWNTAASRAYVDDAVAGKFGYVKKLNKNDDINNIEDGIYFFDESSRPQNYPFQRAALILQFSNPGITVPKNKFQLVANKNGTISYRTKINRTDFTEFQIAATRTEIANADGDPGYVFGPPVYNGETFVGYRDVPSSSGCENAYRKAHQLIDLVWTPSSAIVDYGKGSTSWTFPAGVQQTGLPYSSVKEIGTYVPQDVSISTFMTALQNPHSLIYTENVNGDHSTTAHGFNYNGVPTCGPYYGATCSSFVLYCLGISTRWSTAQFGYLATTGALKKIADQSAAGVQLMDIVWKSGHCALITDIYRDDRGRPVKIIVSEAVNITSSGYKVYQREYSYETFQQRRIVDDKGIIYRYVRLRDNVDYTPTPYNQVEYDPVPVVPAANNDICTYAGDYAAFRIGFPVKINATKGSYTSMIVKQGSTTVANIALEATRDDDYYDVSAYCDTEGKYTAYLTDGANNSEPTHWEMINTSYMFTVTIDEQEHPWYDYPVEVTFQSAASEKKALYIEIVNIAGATRGIYEITAADRKDLTINIDWWKINNDQLPKAEDRLVADENYYIRVIFQGDYGRVQGIAFLG